MLVKLQKKANYFLKMRTTFLEIKLIGLDLSTKFQKMWIKSRHNSNFNKNNFIRDNNLLILKYSVSKSIDFSYE